MGATGALCPHHPLVPALGPCSRCGRFLCEACAVVQDPLQCADCQIALARGGALGVPPFTFGSTLVHGFSFFGRSLAVIAPLALIYAVPEGMLVAREHLSSTWRLALGVPDLALVSACMLAIQRRESAASRAGLVDALNDGITAWPRVFFAKSLAGIYEFLHALLLIVPGVLKALSFAVVVPVVLFEGFATNPLERSTALTQGNRGPILGVFLVVGFIEIVVVAGVALTMKRVLPATGLALSTEITECGVRLATLLTAGLNASVTFALYLGLKERARGRTGT